MNDKKIILIPKEFKHKEYFNYANYNIKLPNYIKASISKYRFTLSDGLYLQRQCADCKNFFTVQIYENDNFTNIENCEIKYIGEKTGFNCRCIRCDSENKENKKDLILPLKDKEFVTNSCNQVQLNLLIDKNLKKEFQLLALRNDTTLKVQIITALYFYRDYINNEL